MSENLQVRISGESQGLSRTLKQAQSDFKGLRTTVEQSKGSFGGWFNSVRKSNNALSNISKDANRSAEGIKGLGSAFAGLRGALGVAGLYAVGDGLAKSMNSALAMIETVNLFNVSLGDTAVKTNAVVQEMSTLYGLDPTNLQSAVGTFSLLARSMGFTSEQASTLGVNTSKLAVDLASLTNVPINQVMADLKSGLVGQSETVYKYGIDVTEAGLKQEAMLQGIQKSVRDMSQGEKMALRYGVMIRRTAIAQGDFARTIDSPANQLKILSERFVTLGRSIGSIFIPILSAVLPYLNAFVKILINVANAIAKFFGYEPPKIQDTVNSAIGGIGDQADKSTDALGGTKKAVKDLKNALMGFDEINLMPQQPKDTGAGGGAGAGGGGGDILPDIKLPSYDNLMEGIKSKSTEIQAQIQAVLDKFVELSKPLMFANWDLLKASVEGLVSSLSGLGSTIGSGLATFYKDVLVPLGVWLIEKGLPAVLDTINSAFFNLNKIMIALSPTGKALLDNLVTPILKLVEGVILEGLSKLRDVFKGLGDWFTENKDTINSVLIGIIDNLGKFVTWIDDNQQKILDIGVAIALFFGAWKLVEIMAFIEMSGGLVGAFSKITDAIRLCTGAKIVDKLETMYLMGLYAKDFVLSIGTSIAIIKDQIVAWGELWIAKAKDGLETLYLAGLYAKDFVVSLASSTWAIIKQTAEIVAQTIVKGANAVATGVMTVATTLYTTAVTIATAVTSAFGVVLAFITSPIGLVVIAVALLVAGIVILIKHWDDVKKAVSNAVDSMGKAWDGFVSNMRKNLAPYLNPMLSSIETFLNRTIDLLNGVILKWNEFKSAVGISGWTPQVDHISIPRLARGGQLEGGALFQAGEFGKAEMVGSYGGKTTVMPLENTDFVGAMYNAVYGAVASAMGTSGNGESGGDVILQVGSTEFGRIAINSINKITKQEGRLALNI